MNSNNDLDFLRSHLFKMKKRTLYRITLELFHVDFDFDGNIHTTVRIKKYMKFEIDGKFGSFDWNEEVRCAIGSCDFVKLIGKRCEFAKIDDVGFRIEFIEGGSVFVALEEGDFEPIEFIGTSGPHGQKLEFYIVL